MYLNMSYLFQHYSRYLSNYLNINANTINIKNCNFKLYLIVAGLAKLLMSPLLKVCF